MIRQFTKIVFLAKNYAPVSSISNQFSTLKNRIKEKYVIQKFGKNCQFQHIFNGKYHSSNFRKTENRNFCVLSVFLFIFHRNCMTYESIALVDHVLCQRELPVWNLKLESSFDNPFYSNEQKYRQKRQYPPCQNITCMRL